MRWLEGRTVHKCRQGPRRLLLSWIPFRDLPVFVNVVAADLFNATPWGTVGVLSVGWGDSLKLGFFNP